MNSLNTINCPECNEAIADPQAIKCPVCGYPIASMKAEHVDSSEGNNPNNEQPKAKKSKKKKIIIISVIVTIICLIAGTLYYYFSVQVPINNSNQAYEAAVEYENNYDYENALSSYLKVIPEDEQNYASASEKCVVLQSTINRHRFASEAVLALINLGHCKNVDEITSMATNSGNTDFSCRIAGIGYIVSKNSIVPKPSGDQGFYSIVNIENVTHLYVEQYKPTFFENGWLTEWTNEIRQEGADYTFQRYQLFTNIYDISANAIKKKLEMYNESGDLSEFDMINN